MFIGCWASEMTWSLSPAMRMSAGGSPGAAGRTGSLPAPSTVTNVTPRSVTVTLTVRLPKYSARSAGFSSDSRPASAAPRGTPPQCARVLARLWTGSVQAEISRGPGVRPRGKQSEGKSTSWTPNGPDQPATRQVTRESTTPSPGTPGCARLRWTSTRRFLRRSTTGCARSSASSGGRTEAPRGCRRREGSRAGRPGRDGRVSEASRASWARASDDAGAAGRWLVRRGLARSREQAAELICAGGYRLAGRPPPSPLPR